MESWRRNLYILLATVFVAQASFTLVTPFMPYFLKSMGLTEDLAVWSGMAYSASSLTGALMSPIWGSIADKYGKRLQILRSGIGIATTYALYPLAKTPLQFVLMRGGTGLLSGFLPAATSLVATNTPEDKMGYALGLFQAVSAAGTISGPLLGGLIVQAAGIPLTFRLSAAVLFLFTILSFVTLREEVGGKSNEVHVLGDIAEAFRNRRLVVVFACLFLVQAAIQVTQPTLVLYIDRLSGGRNTSLLSGLVYSVAGLGTVAGAVFAARQNEKAVMSDKEGAAQKFPPHFGTNEGLFLLGLLGSSACSALQGLWVAIVPLAAFRLLFGAFNGILTVYGNVLAATAVSREFRGRAFGVLNGVLPLGAVAGPMIGGLVGDRLGLGSAFYASSLLFLASGAVLAAFTLVSRPRHGNASAA